MSTVYSAIPRNVVVMEIDFLNDESLSWVAKGVMSFILAKEYLLSKNFIEEEITVEKLYSISCSTEESIDSAIKELVDAEYLNKKEVESNE